MTEKWATAEGTKKFFQWKQIHPSKQRHFETLSISALGMGTRMGKEDDATDKLYEEALIEAALLGINAFDTAIYYRNQRSERVLAKALRELGNRGIFREQLFISTKGGPIASESIEQELLEKGILAPADRIEGSYCMSAPFLAHQIETSLKNLHLDAIDLYLLEDPEVALRSLGELVFYAKLEEAFALFETQVKAQKIRSYGLATWNGFRVKRNTKEKLSLLKILECAQKAGGKEHHFKAIQVPYNLVMLELLKSKHQAAEPSFLQAAKEVGVAIFASSSLMQGQVQNLPQRLYDGFSAPGSKSQKALEFVLATPGILTGYCGMKQRLHLEDNGKVLGTPAWTAESWEKSRALLLG
jgi:aryl-alcohol dehydrogenase-like predicted oxidoreductase